MAHLDLGKLVDNIGEAVLDFSGGHELWFFSGQDKRGELSEKLGHGEHMVYGELEIITTNY